MNPEGEQGERRPAGNPSREIVSVFNEVLATTPVISHDIDKENAFLLYATFCADVPRTAAAVGVTEPEIVALAQAGGWDHRLRGIIELKKSGRAGDVERALNRAINFVQAHKLRVFLERVVQHICSKSLDTLEDWMFTVQYVKDDPKPVRKLATRPFADLAAAIEKCHVLTYMALGDSPSERRQRDEAQDPESSAGDLHARIAAAMAQQPPKVVAKVP